MRIQYCYDVQSVYGALEQLQGGFCSYTLKRILNNVWNGEVVKIHTKSAKHKVQTCFSRTTFCQEDSIGPLGKIIIIPIILLTWVSSTWYTLHTGIPVHSCKIYLTSVPF